MTWPVPTARLAWLAAAAAGFYFVLPGGGSVSIVWFDVRVTMLIINTLLVSMAVFDGAVALSPRQVNIERDHPSAVVLGAPTTLTWQVSLAKPPRLWLLDTQKVLIADELPPSLHPNSTRSTLTFEAPDQPATVTAELRPSRRGRFVLRRIVVRTSGPLGLVLKQRTLPVPSTLDVLPPFRKAKDAQLSLRRARLVEAGMRVSRKLGSGTEFDALRELTPDDDSRRIDWVATARSRHPLVRTYRTERDQTVLCLLDSGRTMAGRVQRVPRLEHSLDATLMLSEVVTGVGDKMGVVAFDRDIRAAVPPASARSHRSRVTRQLFDLQPALVETDYHRAVAYITARHRRRSLLMLLTELGETTREFLLPALPLLVRKHLVVVGAITDPDLARWANASVDDEDGVYLKAGAVQAIQQRNELALQMERLGVHVVQAEPERFAQELTDVYLNAKAVGRL